MTNEGGVGESMAWDRAGRVVICVLGAELLAHREWIDFVQWMRTGIIPVKDTVALVRSLGGGPNTVQRGLLTDMFAAERAKPKTAVLTESAAARGFGVALSWFNPGVRVWSPDQIDAAFGHLALDDSERIETSNILDRLRATVQRSPIQQPP